MNPLLFREEALAARQHRLLGDVHLQRTAVGGWHGTALLLGLLVASVTALFRYEFNHAELVPARVRSDPGVVPLAIVEDGVVKEILIAEGQSVRKGQVLLQLKIDVDLRAGISSSHSARQDLERELVALRNQATSTKSAHEVTQEKLHTERQALLKELDQAQRQLNVLDARVQLAVRHRDAQLELARQGFLARAQVDRAEDALLEQQSSRELMATELLGRRRRVEELATQQRSAVWAGASDLAALEQRTASLQARLTVASNRSDVVVLAPVDGVVSLLHLTAGQSVRAGTTALEILPEDAKLLVEAWIPSLAAVSAHVGDKIQLRFDAYPHERFGTASGTIQRIAPTVAKADGRGTGNDSAGGYKAVLSIDAGPGRLEAARFAPREGMRARALFKGEELSLLSRIVGR